MIGRSVGWAALVIFGAWLLSSISATWGTADSLGSARSRHAREAEDSWRSARSSFDHYPYYSAARTTPRAEYNADGVRFEPGKPAYDPSAPAPASDRYYGRY